MGSSTAGAHLSRGDAQRQGGSTRSLNYPGGRGSGKGQAVLLHCGQDCAVQRRFRRDGGSRFSRDASDADRAA